MRCMIWAELYKLKRYYIVRAGVLLMLLGVLLTLFTSTALDGTEWDFAFLVEQVIKNNTILIFPMCITLAAGYMIAREEQDDTLKNLLTIPVSRRALLGGKLAACGLLSLLLGAASAGFTLLAECLVRFPGFSVRLAGWALVQIPLNCVLLYLAVLPLITLAARFPGGHLAGTVAAVAYGYGVFFVNGSQSLSNLYPVMACLGVMGYRSYDPAVHWNRPLCALSLCMTAALAAVLVLLPLPEQEPKRRRHGQQARKRAPAKKGW